MNLEAIILRKLFRRRIIGAKHTAFEHLVSGIPKHFHGQAKEASFCLIKKGMILAKNTGYGLQVSLNPDKIPDILNMLEDSSEGE